MIIETTIDANYVAEMPQELLDYLSTSDGTIEEEKALLSQLIDYYITKRGEAYRKMYALKDEIRVLERKLKEFGIELASKIDD